MILFSKYIVPKGYTAITLYPFVVLRNREQKADKQLINHEKIHLRQQAELLVVPFYILYSFEFLLRLLYYRNWYVAYVNISFEREAYMNDNNLNYLKTRRFWEFLKYIHTNV